MPMTTAWRNKAGDHLLGKSDIGALADLWVGLLRSNPGDAGSMASEVDAADYARIDVTSLFSAFADTGLGYSEAVNQSLVDFGVPANDWTDAGETLAYVGYFTASTAGEMKFYEAIPVPRAAVANSKAVKWSAGRLKIRAY